MKPVALACLAVLLLIACSDQQPLQPPVGPAPSALIMDGAHHGGNADFFFLPPLAADPTGGPNFDPGKFNPTLAPTAEVCRLSGDPASGAVDCATDTQGQPVLVFGPKPMVLALAGEQYQVTWDTKAPTLLDASKFYRIIVRGAPRGTLLGLLDVDPVTGGIKNVKTGEVVQFQGGRTLPIKVRIEQGAFGVTNPDHVEQVVTNHITTPTGTVDVTTNTGFAGARLVDNWLPAAAVAAGIDRVIVIIERVPVNNGVPATSCLKSGFKELEGCYRFRTDPDLHPYGSFNALVIAGVCFEQPIHTDAPYEMFRREEAGEQELVHLDDSDAPFLNCATFSPTPPAVGVSPGAGPGRLLALASAGLRTLMSRMGRAFTPRDLHAVDLGAGGRTNAFSFFGWARRAAMAKVAATDNQVAFTSTKVQLDPAVCLTSLHPSTRPLVGEPVRFTVTGGGGAVGGGTTTIALTGSDGCASAPWVLGSVAAGNRLAAAAAASPGTVEFMATGVEACDCWTTKASMSTPRYALGVGVIDGILYAVGGFRGSALATVEAYDPASNTWTTKASLPAPRHRLAVGVVNGILYAVGGTDPGFNAVATVEAYDPVTNAWTTKASMPTARFDLAVGVVNGILYAVGGVGSVTQGLATVEAYDPASDMWTTKVSMPTARFGLGVTAINGQLYAVGGASNNPGGGQYATVEAYDPGTDTWTTKAPMSATRHLLGVGAINGVLYAVGGASSTAVPLTRMEAYDPGTDAWTTKASMPTAREFLEVGVANGLFYAVGGAGPTTFTPLGTVEAYQP